LLRKTTRSLGRRDSSEKPRYLLRQRFLGAQYDIRCVTESVVFFPCTATTRVPATGQTTPFSVFSDGCYRRLCSPPRYLCRVLWTDETIFTSNSAHSLRMYGHSHATRHSSVQQKDLGRLGWKLRTAKASHRGGCCRLGLCKARVQERGHWEHSTSCTFSALTNLHHTNRMYSKRGKKLSL
jgi:hypothetical protein